MTDNKPTDNENKRCKSCIHHVVCIFHETDYKAEKCVDYIEKDLINRLQAENEKLKKEKYIFSTVDYCADDLDKALKENDKLKAENERLKESLLEEMYGNKEKAEEIRAEAIKEFAERLKKDFSQHQREYRAVLNSDGACAMIIAKRVTDNLLKEMVGDNDA